MQCQRISITQSLILRRCSPSKCSGHCSRCKHRWHLHQLSIRVSSSPLRPSQDKRACPAHLLGGTEAHPPPPKRLGRNLCHMISNCRSSRDHLAPNAQGGCHPHSLRFLTMLQAHQLMDKPLSHLSSSPSQAGSRRSPSPVSKAPRRLLPALPLLTPANDARHLVSSHSERSVTAPSRSPSPKRQRQSRPSPDDCAPGADEGIPKKVPQAPGRTPKNVLQATSPASNNTLKAQTIFPQHHVQAPTHVHLHSLEIPFQMPEEPSEGPSSAPADALQARLPSTFWLI